MLRMTYISMSNRFIKFIVLLVITLISGVVALRTVYAEGLQYSLSEQNINVSFEEDISSKIVHTQIAYSTIITNNSDKFLISELKFNISPQINLSTVKINSKNISFEDNKGEIVINLNDSSIDLGQKAQIEMIFKGEDVSYIEDFRRVFLPGFKFLNSVDFPTINIQAPISWGDIRYVSSKYEVKNNSDIYNISLITDKDLLLIFGKCLHIFGIQKKDLRMK